MPWARQDYCLHCHYNSVIFLLILSQDFPYGLRPFSVDPIGLLFIQPKKRKKKIGLLFTFYHFMSIHNRKCHPILFYHLKKAIYQLYHVILQYTQYPKTLLFYHFIEILFFNLSLLFLSNKAFFFFKFNYSNGQLIFNNLPFFFSISFQLFQQPAIFFFFFF